MRIVLISFSILPTFQKYLYNSAAALGDQGHEVLTVGSRHLAIPASVPPTGLLVDTPSHPRPGFRSVLAAIKETHALSSKIRDFRPDVIHFVNKHTWNYLLILRLRHGTARIFHTFHDPIGHSGDKIRHGVVLYHKVIQRKLNGIFVHSPIALRQTRQRLRPKCPVALAPLGERNWLHYRSAELHDPRSLLIFGRLNNYKGCELYPRILARLFELEPTWSVTIAGKPSPDLSRELLEQIRACPNVRLVDRFIDESEVEGFYNDADLVLMPYTSITQSGVVLDAYSRSKSIHSFNIDGMADLVPMNQQLVRPFDVDSYVAEIVKLLHSPSDIRDRNHESWRFGGDNFTPKRMAEEFLKGYVSTRIRSVGN